jgi:hypothetical protein
LRSNRHPEKEDRRARKLRATGCFFIFFAKDDQGAAAAKSQEEDACSGALSFYNIPSPLQPAQPTLPYRSAKEKNYI